MTSVGHYKFTSVSPEIKKILEWRRDPIKFTMDNFHVTPDPWQAEALTALLDPVKFRIVLCAAAGVGKTAMMVWGSWWFFSLFSSKTHRPIGNALSETDSNLKTGFWKEMKVWQDKSEWLKSEFVYSATKIVHKKDPTWVFATKTFNTSTVTDEIGSNLSGVHSTHVIWVGDEIGKIPPKVGSRMEQAIPGAERIILLYAGNPLVTTGMLYDCAVRRKHQHKVINISSDPDDPNRCTRVPKHIVEEEIRMYGRDDPWVMAYRLGQFPSTSVDSLLSYEEYAAATKRYLSWTRDEEDRNKFMPTIMGVDIAYGGLDKTVIQSRTGRKFHPPVMMRTDSTEEIVSAVIAEYNKQTVNGYAPHNIFVDATGVGAPIVEALYTSAVNLPVVGIKFNNKPDNKDRFLNKRSEMLGRLREAVVKRDYAFPPSAELENEVVAVLFETTPQGVRKAIDKKLIKESLKGKSPDITDAMALTFAYEQILTHQEPTLNDIMMQYHPNPHPMVYNNQQRTVQSQARLSFNPYKRRVS